MYFCDSWHGHQHMVVDHRSPEGSPSSEDLLSPPFSIKPAFAEIPYFTSASFQVSPWLFLMCAFKLLILCRRVSTRYSLRSYLTLHTLHTGQQKGFSPVCILMCMINFCFEMNFLLH